METIYPNWLSSQMISGVKGFNLCANLVALEGWKRGLRLRWYENAEKVTNLKVIGFDPTGKTFSLISREKRHFFFRSRGDKVANEAVEIGTNKEKTKLYLDQAGINVPKGLRFTNIDNKEIIIEKALQMGFPLVLKPTFGSLGKGVVTGIISEEVLQESLLYIVTELGYTDIIVERYIKGEDLRVYVVGNKVLGALKRIPANITGNGIHSVEELISYKNEIRRNNPSLRSKLIKIDQQVVDYLSKRNLSLSGVPNKGDVIFLKGQANISAGGDSIDISDEILQDVRDIAISAVAAIDGLNHAGVDLIVSDNEASVIEINPTADIAMHIFPSKGSSRNIPAGIIDYYFPDTKGLASDSNKIYFDYHNILELIRSKSINQVEIADAPVGEMYAKRFIISGKVQNVGYRQWIRKQALKNNLNGYTRNLDNGRVVVVVGDVNKGKVNDFKNVVEEGPLKADVKSVQEFNWDRQIKIGFEIRKDSKKSN